MNSAGTYKTHKRKKYSNEQCIRCGRNGCNYESCYESTDVDGKLLNYCKCLRCRDIYNK